jgi:hypothetical protein
MASTAKWVSNLRQSIKNTCGTGWSVGGRESKGELLTQVTFRYPDNQGRTAANVNLAWNAKNTFRCRSHTVSKFQREKKKRTNMKEKENKKKEEKNKKKQ